MEESLPFSRRFWRREEGPYQRNKMCFPFLWNSRRLSSVLRFFLLRKTIFGEQSPFGQREGEEERQKKRKLSHAFVLSINSIPCLPHAVIAFFFVSWSLGSLARKKELCTGISYLHFYYWRLRGVDSDSPRAQKISSIHYLISSTFPHLNVFATAYPAS